MFYVLFILCNFLKHHLLSAVDTKYQKSAFTSAWSHYTFYQSTSRTSTKSSRFYDEALRLETFCHKTLQLAALSTLVRFEFSWGGLPMNKGISPGG